MQSELHTWLPSVSCIFYVGTKDHRSKLYSQVSAPQLIGLYAVKSILMFSDEFPFVLYICRRLWL